MAEVKASDINRACGRLLAPGDATLDLELWWVHLARFNAKMILIDSHLVSLSNAARNMAVGGVLSHLQPIPSS